MANSTIANLTDGVTADATDRIPVERSPYGSGKNRYITPAYITTATLTIGKAVTGGAANAVLYEDGSQNLAADATNLNYTSSSGPVLQVGSGSGTSNGIKIGYAGSSGYSGIFNTNQSMTTSSPGIVLGAGGDIYETFASNQSWNLYVNTGPQKLGQLGTAGRGLDIIGGTATTDVAALSITRTNNNAAVATGCKVVFTDTTSAAGFLPEQVLGGSAGTTLLRSLGKTGIATYGDKVYPGSDAAAAQSACGLYANTGAPNNANGANGDIYFRADGGALTTIYQRRAGAWVGIV